MKRIKLFEDFPGKKGPLYTEDELYDAFKMCDFESMVSIDLEKTTFNTKSDSFYSEEVASDPGFLKSTFEFYISDSKFFIDVDKIKKEVKRNLLNVKSDDLDDDDLLKDLSTIGINEKLFSFQDIMDNLGDEKLMATCCWAEDADFSYETMVDDPKANPAEVWSKISGYNGKVEFDNSGYLYEVMRNLK